MFIFKDSKTERGTEGKFSELKNKFQRPTYSACSSSPPPQGQLPFSKKKSCSGRLRQSGNGWGKRKCKRWKGGTEGGTEGRREGRGEGGGERTKEAPVVFCTLDE